MAGRMSKSSSQQWAGAHALSGEAGGGRVAERCTIGWATRAGGGVLDLPFCFPRALTLGGGGGDVGGEGGVGAGVDDCVGGGAVGEGGMGVRVDEVGAGLWLMVVSWWVSCCRCRRRRWCWCL